MSKAYFPTLHYTVLSRFHSQVSPTSPYFILPGIMVYGCRLRCKYDCAVLLSHVFKGLKGSENKFADDLLSVSNHLLLFNRD